MGFGEFLLAVCVVCGLAWLAVSAIAYFASPNGPPAIIPKLIWGVAVLIIVVLLARALGLLGHDVQIPRIF